MQILFTWMQDEFVFVVKPHGKISNFQRMAILSLGVL